MKGKTTRQTKRTAPVRQRLFSNANTDVRTMALCLVRSIQTGSTCKKKTGRACQNKMIKVEPGIPGGYKKQKFPKNKNSTKTTINVKKL